MLKTASLTVRVNPETRHRLDKLARITRRSLGGQAPANERLVDLGHFYRRFSGGGEQEKNLEHGFQVDKLRAVSTWPEFFFET